jgi:cytoskeletal protein CcmA (bactofilin family)
MALWKDTGGKANPAERPKAETAASVSGIGEVLRATGGAEGGAESLIAAGLTIEGKISGEGHVRLAGRFKGEVDIKGDLAVEGGASLGGNVRAKRVQVGGEIQGNVQASSVELNRSACVIGDIKATTLVVAAGSRLRGQVECGFEAESTRAAAANASGASPPTAEKKPGP